MSSSADEKNFFNLSEEDIKKLVTNADSENTKKQTKQAVKSFYEYLRENELDPEFETYYDHCFWFKWEYRTCYTN